jgi:starch synthase
MKIAIATLGRFHVLDLARELDALGHDVKFYSYVPLRRAKRFGLPNRCHVSLLILLWPFVLLAALKPRGRVGEWIDSALHRLANYAVMLRLRPCDVFICMSGIYLEAARYARKKYGASIVLERGSCHIEEQHAILQKIHSVNPEAGVVKALTVQRELQGYALADIVMVPSRYAAKTFTDRGFSKERLYINNYGTDLSVFRPSKSVERRPQRLLFVGRWSLQKGTDLIAAALLILDDVDLELIHIGPTDDGPIIHDRRFKTIGVVDQSKLPEWYQSASAIVLPSRQEGLALVLLQGLACGCRVLASNATGAADLREGLSIKEYIELIDLTEDAPELALANSIRRHLAQPSLASLPVHEVFESWSWNRYGKRYSDILVQRLPVKRC